MVQRIALGTFEAEVEFKDIRNVHLVVLPPMGRVRISAPRRMALDTVRVFALSKLGWIKEQRDQLARQEREPVREYLERESHYLWGRRYLLNLAEADAAPSVALRHRSLRVTTRPGADQTARAALMSRWYRDRLRERAAPLVERWRLLLGVEVRAVYVQHMKTKWGSCSPSRQTIRLNTELAKKPPACLEYVIVHELLHLLEPNHGPYFRSLMNAVLPQWEAFRAELNRLPVRHEHWTY